jgi:hypothetical protein
MRLGKALLLAAWIGLLLFGFGKISAKTYLLSQEHYSVLAAPALSRLDTRFINILTLGHRGLYDDYLTITAIQFLADKKIRQMPTQRVFDTIKGIARHEPHNEAFYTLSCFVLAVDLGHSELCEPITMYGLKAHPKSWKIPALQGFIFAFKLNSPEDALQYYDMALSRPNAPKFFKGIVTLLRDGGSISNETGEKLLRQIFQTPNSDNYKPLQKEP